MTRQRAWQRRMRAAGRCTTCGAEAHGRSLCPAHAEARYLRVKAAGAAPRYACGVCHKVGHTRRRCRT